MIAVGIDFGTSNCAVGTVTAEVPRLLPLEADSTLLPAVLYAVRADPQRVTLNEATLARWVTEAKAAQTRAVRKASQEGRSSPELSDQELRSQGEAALTRDAQQQLDAKARAKSFPQVLTDANAIWVGSEALKAHLADPQGGLYFRSPKRFLGSDLQSAQQARFQYVVSAMLFSIRQKAEASLAQGISRAVIGRPFTYNEVTGKEGDRSAIRLMEGAAADAGFQEIQFLLEPIAAGLQFEQTLRSEKTVLILDIGGGTTDCSVVRLGPARAKKANRDADVLASAGQRVGGVDIDEALAWESFMPLFGRGAQQLDGRPVSNVLLHQAVSVHDIPSQQSFYSAQETIDRWLNAVTPRLPIERLARLRDDRLTHRLVRSSELTKIALTDKASVTTSLDYIENALDVDVSREDLRRASARILERLVGIAAEAVRLAGTKPDTVFVTGGTARSPIVMEAIQKSPLSGVEVVVGDLFGSVATGLAIQADRVFRDA